MPVVRHHLRRFTWIALFAMLGLVFGPTLAWALNEAPGGASPWTEICSVAADRQAADGAAPGHAPAPVTGLHLEHCPLCGHLGAAPALPAAPVAALQTPDGADFVPVLFAASPRPLFAWAAAQPRGPPRLS